MKKLWWKYARLPLTSFTVLAGILATTRFDIAIAQALFFDAVHNRWTGAGNWWINEVVHTGGSWAVRVIVVIAVATCIAGCFDRNLRALRRPAAFFSLSVVLSVGIVGLLKVVTNVDCPWDLTTFGGRYPFVHLFADRPDALRYGRCFPAAHASSGYALLALYFAFRERSAAAASAGLVIGIGIGLVFGLAQQARGAHFVSHDVWSAFVAWMVALTLYAFVFSARLWNPAATSVENDRAKACAHEAFLPTRRLGIDGTADLELRTGRLRWPASQ